MAGLLAWAADVVGGSGQGNGEGDGEGRFPVIVFTPEQQQYVRELDRKSASLRSAIQDLRLRIPPQDISKSLPHLHAHSLASNADLALQLNAHSTTRQQAQLREVTLQEENNAYEKAIWSCQKKIQEKLQEADLLRGKLKEMELSEKKLRLEMESLESNFDHHQSTVSLDSEISKNISDFNKPSKSALTEQLHEKKKELISMEEIIQDLEKNWARVHQDSIKKPSAAQREKTLERQLHGLIEQLTAKQTQADGLSSEIQVKKLELDKLNGLCRTIETGNAEENTTRSRFLKGGAYSADYGVEAHHKRLTGGKQEIMQKFVFLRSIFVLYILALHVLVFIKISSNFL